MKLSLSSFTVFQPFTREYGDAERLRAFRRTGFGCIDFEVRRSMLGADSDAQAEYWKQRFRECDLQATQAHAPCLNPLLPGDAGAAAREELIRTLYFCKKAGFPAVVIHPGAVENNTQTEFFEKNVRFYHSLIPHIEETGVGVQVENIGHYMDSYFLWSGADLRRLLDAVGHPMVTACWDFGHANHFEYMHGGNPYASVLALGEKLTAIHVHDNVGFFPDPNRRKRVDMHVIPYASTYTSVNWDAVMQGLKDIHYNGTFNFESNTPCAATGRPAFVYHGETVRTLETFPLPVWEAMTAAVYELGKYMLKAYGMYDE